MTPHHIKENYLYHSLKLRLYLPSVQHGAGDWSVGTVLQGAELCDHQEYVAKLAEAKRKGKPRDVVPEHTVSTQIINVEQAIKEVLEESTQLQHRDDETLAKQTSAELEMENMKLKEQVGQLQKQVLTCSRIASSPRPQLYMCI